MKKMILLTIMAITFGFLVTSNARAGVIDDRMQKQRWRIKQGIRSGALVNFEAKILKKEQRRIRMAKRYAKSDGRFTRKERRKIMRMQDRASRHIFRLKHNHIRRHWKDNYPYRKNINARRY